MVRASVVNKLRYSLPVCRCTALVAVAIVALVPWTSAHEFALGDDDRDNSLDVRSSVGDMHLGSDADIRETGLPPYPGARIRKPDEHHNSADFALFTSAFGFKLVVVNFDSDDAPVKVISFYKEKLKKYGSVLECHTTRRGADVDADEDSDGSHTSKKLTCEGDNTGPVVELKAGTEDNQHVVAVEPAEKGKGTTFAVVYVRTRGRQGDI
jgi:hypothetical protein